jgi:hypothetical protein
MNLPVTLMSNSLVMSAAVYNPTEITGSSSVEVWTDPDNSDAPWLNPDDSNNPWQVE